MTNSSPPHLTARSDSVTDEYGLDRVAFDRLTVNRRLLAVELRDKRILGHVYRFL
jgi:hypothetical protein